MHGSQLVDHGREVLGGGGDQDLQVDGPIAAHDPVPQPGRLLPGDLGVFGPEVLGELSGGLPEDNEVLEQGVTTLAIRGQ